MRWGVRRYENYDGTLKHPKKSREEKRAERITNRFEKKSENINELYGKSRVKQEDLKGVERLTRSFIPETTRQLKEKYPDLTNKEARAFAQEKSESWKKVAIATGVVGVGALAAYAAVKYGRDYADQTIKAGTTIQTLSHDPTRLDKGRAFYTTFRETDKQIYAGRFGGKGSELKYAITSVADKDLKIASAKTGEKVFKQLLANDPEFSRSFAECKRRLSWQKSKYLSPYDLFNSAMLPLDDTTDIGRKAGKMLDTFYGELKKQSYSGLIDINDTRYSRLRAVSPTIMFDKSGLSQQSVRKLTMDEHIKGLATAEAVVPTLHLLTDKGISTNWSLATNAIFCSTVIMAGAIDKAFDRKVESYIRDKKKYAGVKSSKSKPKG